MIAGSSSKLNSAIASSDSDSARGVCSELTEYAVSSSNSKSDSSSVEYLSFTGESCSNISNSDSSNVPINLSTISKSESFSLTIDSGCSDELANGLIFSSILSVTLLMCSIESLEVSDSLLNTSNSDASREFTSCSTSNSGSGSVEISFSDSDLSSTLTSVKLSSIGEITCSNSCF